MNIDERLEKLAERHEALAQTVELIAAEQRDMQRAADARVARLEEAMTKMAGAMSNMMDAITNHEKRIDRLEEL